MGDDFKAGNDFENVNRALFQLYLILILLLNSKTNQEHSDFVNLARALFLAPVFFAFVISIFGNLKFFVLSVIPFTALAIYGYARSLASSGTEFEYLWQSNNLEITATVFFTFVLLASKLPVFNIAALNKVIFFLVALTISMVYFGGINLDGIPKFIIYRGDEIDYYSQGISKIYGIGFLFSVLGYFHARENRGAGRWYLFAMPVFFFLMVQGGARGEIVVAILMAVAAVHIQGGVSLSKLATFSLFAVVAIYVFSDSIINAGDDFYFIKRFATTLDGNFGARDSLIADSILLLESDEKCALFGCGYGFFQYFNHYDMNLYPHNIVFEIIITFGIFVSSAIFFCASLGYLRDLKVRDKHNYFMYIAIYFIFIGIKGGFIFDYTSVPFIYYYFIRFFASAPSRSDQESTACPA